MEKFEIVDVELNEGFQKYIELINKIYLKPLCGHNLNKLETYDEDQVYSVFKEMNDLYDKLCIENQELVNFIDNEMLRWFCSSSELMKSEERVLHSGYKIEINIYHSKVFYRICETKVYGRIKGRFILIPELTIYNINSRVALDYTEYEHFDGYIYLVTSDNNRDLIVINLDTAKKKEFHIENIMTINDGDETYKVFYLIESIYISPDNKYLVLSGSEYFGILYLKVYDFTEPFSLSLDNPLAEFDIQSNNITWIGDNTISLAQDFKIFFDSTNRDNPLNFKTDKDLTKEELFEIETNTYSNGSLYEISLPLILELETMMIKYGEMDKLVQEIIQIGMASTLEEAMTLIDKLKENGMDINTLLREKKDNKKD